MRNMLTILIGLLFGLFLSTATVYALDSIVHVTVCHETGSSSNPYIAINVSVHSVDDARGLNGHGDHTGDAWQSFVFDGVTYPGQNEGLFGSIIDGNCNLIQPTEVPSDTPTSTSTATATPTATETKTATSTATQPTATQTATSTATSTMTGTPHDPTATSTSTATTTGTQPSPTQTASPTSTPTDPQTPTPTQEPTMTATPRPPIPAEADSIKTYPGILIGAIYMDNHAYSLYEGIKNDNGVLSLPSAERGAAIYRNVVWVHRAWNSGWLNLKVGDTVTVYTDNLLMEYEIISTEEIQYGVYPKADGWYIATCMSSDGKNWTNVELFKLRQVYRTLLRSK